LLNERFMQDLKSTQAARGCPCPPNDWAPFFLPHPPPEVCQLFNDYVRCRWPIYVFALDPETEDQNVGDAFSLRRELQLAMSLAFTSGQISARNFTRYVRRIEKDIDTIAINRTMVGFSHGDNTFGWRFYPRVQTPPIDGNFQAIFRDLLIGGQDARYDLRRRRLEPGIRECVALVIMPSFVPYVDLEVTGNWFHLANPKCKLLDMHQTMRLSKSVRRIEERGAQVNERGHYRPGDVSLMMRRVDQLSQRLPLQYQLVSVPYENTHGGFELLSTGVTDLAPDLHGWYGAPGINPDCDTTLILVGDNFSVHQTRVVVGGRMLDPSCLIACSGALCTTDCQLDKGQSGSCGCASSVQDPTGDKQKKAMLNMEPASAVSSAKEAEGSITPDSRAELGSPTAADEPESSEVVQAGLWKHRKKPTTAAPPVTIVHIPQSAAAFLPKQSASTTVTTAAMTIQDPRPKDPSPKDPSPKDPSWKDPRPKDPSPKDPTPKDPTPKDPTPKSSTDKTPKDPSPKDPTPKDPSPKDPSPKDPSPKDPTPKDPTPKDSTPKDSTPKDVTTTVVNYTKDLVGNPAPPPSYYLQTPHFQVELLSRQVMRIVIPKGVMCLNGFVDVHIATPYGVSSSLQIPVLCSTCTKPKVEGYSVRTGSDAITIKYKQVKKDKVIEIQLSEVGGKFLIDRNIATAGALKKVNLMITFGGKDQTPVTLNAEAVEKARW
jgi:hypothetical protein